MPLDAQRSQNIRSQLTVKVLECHKLQLGVRSKKVRTRDVTKWIYVSLRSDSSTFLTWRCLYSQEFQTTWLMGERLGVIQLNLPFSSRHGIRRSPFPSVICLYPSRFIDFTRGSRHKRLWKRCLVDTEYSTIMTSTGLFIHRRYQFTHTLWPNLFQLCAEESREVYDYTSYLKDLSLDLKV